MQYNTIQSNTIQYNPIQYNTIQYNCYIHSFRIVTHGSQYYSSKAELGLPISMLTPKFVINGIPFYWGGEERKQLTEDAMSFQFRPDDILVAGFPRSGKKIVKLRN